MAITLQAAILMAQKTANRDDAPMAVLNLNKFQPLYVVRDWDDRFNGLPDLIARVYPNGLKPKS